MMKKLFVLLLVLCMVFSLCACGGNSDTEDDSQKDKIENNQDDNDVDADVEDEDEIEDDTEAENTAAFKVTVVDEGGNPVTGVMVQICKESCVPAMTDANGVATFNNVEITDGYKLSVMSAPEGYEFSTEEIYLEDGATEYTLTVKAVQ